MFDKEIKFSEKKVDDSWKETVRKEAEIKSAARPQAAADEPTTVGFMDFVSSLGMQALIHLGVVDHPATRRKEPNAEAAKETIDLLVMLKNKTKGNLTAEEASNLTQLLTDLQMRYVESTQ